MGCNLKMFIKPRGLARLALIRMPAVTCVRGADEASDSRSGSHRVCFKVAGYGNVAVYLFADRHAKVSDAKRFI
jgi:hypothetical protein